MTLTLLPIATALFHLKGGTRHHIHTRTVSSPADRRHRRGAIHHAVDDAIIRVIGRSGFDIGSRYDRIAIPMHAVQSERYEARETVLVIDPTDPVKGPQLRLQLRVDPPSKKLLAGSLASTAALGAIGFAALLPIGTFWQALIIVAAVITIAVLSFFGLYVTALAGVKIPSLTSSSAGGAPTPTPTPPAGH